MPRKIIQHPTSGKMYSVLHVDFLATYQALGYTEVADEPDPPVYTTPATYAPVDDAGAWDSGESWTIGHADGRVFAVTLNNYLNRYAALGFTLLDRESHEPAGYWRDTRWDRRAAVAAVNTTGLTLHDYLVTVAAPAGADAASLRAVEVVAPDGAGSDNAFDRRYLPTSATTVNRLPLVPVALVGGQVVIKALGRWAAGETRRWAVYWQATPTASALDYHHLGPIANTWVATALAGTAGDTYTLVAGGQTYTYTMLGGDTATTIATGLRALVNAGSVATAGGSAGTINVSRVNLASLTFIVANTGTTVPANLAVVPPQYWQVGRTGPDTDAFAPATYAMGLPYSGTAAGATLGHPAFGRSLNQALRTMQYRVNGDGTAYGTTSSTIDTLVVDGPQIRATGTLTFSTRAGGVDWTGTWAATYAQKMVAADKNDGSAPLSVYKLVDVMRIQITYVCARQYAPNTVLASVTTATNFEVFASANLDTSFAGNTTTPVGEQVPNFTAPVATGVITSYAASANLSALPITGTIVGSAGNTVAMGVLVNSLTLSGFTASPVPIWASQGNAYGLLQFVGTASTTPIPVGATIAVDCWFVSSKKVGLTTLGDNLMPSELVALLRGLAASPTVAVARAESLAVSGILARTLALEADRARASANWFRANSLAHTGVANNGGWRYHTVTGAVRPCDDDDAMYGLKHLLAGLCLRYLRTHDATLLPEIEAEVQAHLDIEAACVAQYGSWWSGTSPYWYWPTTDSSLGGYPVEGGFAGDAAQTDPNFNGGVPGLITYTTPGQVSRRVSSDQLNITMMGLGWHYLYLLRNEPAIVANTTLRANALAYLDRLATFEAAHVSASVCAGRNLHNRLIGQTPTGNTGLTDSNVTNPYRGVTFAAWQDSNATNQQAAPDANTATINFFRSVYSPDGTNAATLRWLRGRAMEVVGGDFGLHDVVAPTSVSGAIGPYPIGWQSQVNANIKQMYASPRTVASDNGYATDLHYLQVTDLVGTDHLAGRAAQRLVPIALLALLDPTYRVPVEMSGATVLRDILVTDYLDALLRTCAAYLPDPSGHSKQFVAGYQGKSSGFDPQWVDNGPNGMWAMAIELWYLVQARSRGELSPADYYRFAGV
jgi:hypothetical protein